jgi:DNA (cytosine-5)-methyltransferase 1
MHTGPTAIEMFAGGGFLSHAFQRVGFRVIQAIEIDPIACKTYARNVGQHIEVGNVAKVSPVGRTDVLIAGPPCQGFSTLGARRKRDPRNNLSLEIVRWAQLSRPRAVLVENVAAFLQSSHCNRLVVQLERLGYACHAFVLNAIDYGVPQLRQRSFIFATKSGKTPMVRRCQGGIKNVREAWRGLTRIPNGKNFHTSPVPSELAYRRMAVIPQGGDKRDVMTSAPELAPPSWWKLNCQVTDAWGRMRWDEPSNTLRTALQNPSKGRYIHPSQHRVISLREAARLHTIPDEWEFVGLPTQVARQIGNSVPPALGTKVARALYDLL